MEPDSSSPSTSQAAAATGGLSTIHIRLILVVLGLLCLALSVTAKWLRPDQAEVLSLWAMIGLGLAAIPVLIDSLTSLKSDGFEATKYYMDQFVALAILACFATGKYATGTIVAAILIVGQILEEHTTLGVEEAVRSLLRLSRVKARVLGPFGESIVDAADLQLSDRVRVLPGETIPADGRIISGTTTIDQATITGESLPVEAAAGASVFAGTTNLSGMLEVQVTQIGNGTVLGRVTKIVEEAKTSRAPVMRLIDRYTQYYMPLVLLIAGFVLFFTRDVQRAIAVIIVAMPCAFVLASPSAMVAALAVAARMGVLVKGSRFFETAGTIDTIVFDKTGTLTTGRLAVVAVEPTADVTEDLLIARAAALEVRSNHPVARAIVVEAARRGLVIRAAEQIEEIAGCGLHSGELSAGRREWLASRGVAIPAGFADDETATALYVACGGALSGRILLSDTLREEAGAAIRELRALGVDSFAMLTGDRSAVAAAVAREAGIDSIRAECLPEEKLAEVQALKARGRRVLVIGDGVNDAPALAAGDLGVAMGALGSDAAIQTADVALMGNDLRHLGSFLKLSDRAMRVINQNLVWGFGFIVLFIVLSAFGLISPVVAAVLHEFSAFFVILNSARLLRFDDSGV